MRVFSSQVQRGGGGSRRLGLSRPDESPSSSAWCLCALAPGWQIRFRLSEVKATTAATCLISNCFPGQRKPSFSALSGGKTGPAAPGLKPPTLSRPRPPRPPEGGVFGLLPAAGVLNWAAIRRCASSLSASLSFQAPLKSTPEGGPCVSFSLAQDARHITDRTTTRRMLKFYNEAQIDR